ncbi:enoyl-CoA hydratase [Rhodococcus hoagii]|nr:enoyl-CoA hydratase [Prescottella equi]NKS72414.1 enoyl-CoA hydratase [Prescottella equi]NKZ92585.1 enoyl-CoA hydratase [Prescottella equi]
MSTRDGSGSAVLRRRRGAVLTLTLNRPARRNALDDDARRALVAELVAAGSDPGIRAIVLTGSGRFFCAGGDVASMSTEPEALRARMTVLARLARAIVESPVPVVAAVEGGASGLGLSLAAACDHVVAAEDSRLTASFVRLGLVADTGLFWSLVGRIGPARTRRLLLFGDDVDAEEALSIGLVDEVVAAGATVEAASARADRLSVASTAMVEATRRILRSPWRDLGDVLAAESDAQIRRLASEDFAEGRRAFFEGRPPVFVHPSEK